MYRYLRLATVSEFAAGRTLGERVRAACLASRAWKSNGYGIAWVQDRVDRQFRYFEALGEFRMFAPGAVFIGARVTSVDDTRARIRWTSAFYPGPRHRQVVRGGQGELLPLGFHGRFDLYLRRAIEMPVDAHQAIGDVSPNAESDVIVVRSDEGETTTFDFRQAGGMPADVVDALREGMLRARLLAAGPS